MLFSLKDTSTEIDCEFVEKIITHHLRRSQESITALCRLLEVNRRGELDTAALLIYSQWT
jgi:hypothetical protein